MSSRQRSTRYPVNKGQIKAIHALKRALGMDEETYRQMLSGFAGVQSSKELTTLQADRLIVDMKRKAGQDTLTRHSAGRHESLQGRPGMATPAQLRKIEATWREVSRAEDPAARAKALRGFLFRIARVSDLRFLDSKGASKIICALETMMENAKSKGGA